MVIGLCALGGAAFLVALNLVAMMLAGLRWRRALRRPVETRPDRPPVTILRPLRGIETFSKETLASSFCIEWPDYEVIFCVANAQDPVVPLVREAIAQHPGVPARLLIGDDSVSENPKLNNCVKGWRAARHGWIVMADSNVLMPPDYLARLMSRTGNGVGLVISVPLGTQPAGLYANLECAILNGYQARWQYAGAACGRAFAQGKNMLWRRDILDGAGGIAALGAEAAEDAAATKIMRRLGLRIEVVDYPFPQPLGARTARQVWSRHSRWARLRRATFPLHYAPEILAGAMMPMLLAALGASLLGIDVLPVVTGVVICLYGAEWLLLRVAKLQRDKFTLPAMILRDLWLPVFYFDGWLVDEFVWHGQAMGVTPSEATPAVS